VFSGFCSGGDRIAAGCGFATRPADDDVGVFPDDVVGVLLAIAAHVIGFAGFTVENRHTRVRLQYFICQYEIITVS